MGLVDYTSSSESESEQASKSTLSTSISSKPGFQKVVDPSKPGKIRVNLTAPAPTTEANQVEQPPIKRQRTGGLSGLNALLPPPKRVGVVGNASRGLGSGLGSGVSLKTGSERGFDREGGDGVGEFSSSSGLNLPPPRGAAIESTPIPAEEVKLIGKPMMFKPLSVARNNKKKKSTSGTSAKSPIPATGTHIEATKTSTITESTPRRPKVSLFSMPTEPEEEISDPSTSSKPYEPLIYGTKPDPEEALSDIPTSRDESPTQPPQTTQSLQDIASDLNLSASDRRQLFGRASKSSSHLAPNAQTVLNFNMDTEYMHNETVRASGETVSHNPVRSINPGKHSLKQLVEIASSNKEALEESFAKGRNNRNEAAGRYGW